MSFKDHFSERAAEYARFRPGYPAALFAFLASVAPRRGLAWDCGTGNGQAAIGLAEHFRAVLATDPSAAQIAHARPHPAVTYRTAREGESGLAGGTVDLVTAAQAFHWFDQQAFFDECRRVLGPGGVVAIWCYGLHRIEPGLDRVIDHFYRDVVGPFWAPERRQVESGYRDVPFPFVEIAAPTFVIEAGMDLRAVGDYVGTWSAVRRYRAEQGADPVPALMAELARGWGAPSDERVVRWPIAMRLGGRGTPVRRDRSDQDLRRAGRGPDRPQSGGARHRSCPLSRPALHSLAVSGGEDRDAKTCRLGRADGAHHLFVLRGAGRGGRGWTVRSRS